MKNSVKSILLAACLAGCSSSQDSSPADGGADLGAIVHVDGYAVDATPLQGSPDAVAAAAPDAGISTDARCPRIVDPAHPTGSESWNCEGCLPRAGQATPSDSEGADCADVSGRSGTCRALDENSLHAAYSVCCAGCWDADMKFCRPVADPAACGGKACGTSAACEDSR